MTTTSILLLHDGKSGIIVSVPTLLDPAARATSNGEGDPESGDWFIVNLTLERGALELIDNYLHGSRGERHD